MRSPRQDSEDSESASSEDYSLDENHKMLVGTAFFEKQLLEITDVQNKAAVHNYVKKYFEGEDYALHFSSYFTTAIEIGRQKLDFRAYELEIKQANEACYRMSLDLKKAKSERDLAFTNHFDKVVKDLLVAQENLDAQLAEVKRKLQSLTVLTDSNVSSASQILTEDPSLDSITPRGMHEDLSVNKLIRIFQCICKLMKLIADILSVNQSNISALVSSIGSMR